YVNNSLSVGDRVYLGASDGLPAGFYTLLPARYALLPGGFLVTPKSGTPAGSLSLPGGVNIVSGYRSNGLDTTQSAPSVYSRFEVISQDVVRQRAQYDDFSANRFIRDTALAGNAQPQLLPIDAGHLTFQGTETLRLNGSVLGQAPFGGRGAFIDVSSPSDIIIAGADTNLSQKQTKDAIVLNAAKLSAWDAESLLIGGIRQDGEEGTTVSVDTGNLTVDNAGSLLTGPEIILVADKTLTLAPHAEISQSGYLTGHAETLLLDGDGAMLRVSSDRDAAYARTNVTGAHDVNMKIGAGARISALSLTLDSSYGTDLSPRATLRGHSINLASGQISIALSDPGEVLPTDGLVLAGRALRSLRGADALSLLSYTSIDIYGSGELGTTELEDLGLHAGEIRGFNNTQGVTITASHVTLDNSANGKGPGSIAAATGGLKVHAKTLELGAHRLNVDQFSEVGIRASGGVLLGAKGKFFVDSDLDITTSSLFAIGGAIEAIRAAGDLRIAASSGKPDPGLSSGLGASLTLQGASVTANADLLLPSGQLTLHATTGNVNVNGRLDVGGTAQQFNDLVKYTSGGSIDLLADQGDVNLGKGGSLFLSAQKDGGNAGSLNIAATGVSSSVNLDGELFGQGGKGGRGGSFSLDVGTLPELNKLSSVLADASFTESQSFRVRHGDVVVSGTTNVRAFSLSADEGSITVTGTIDASGETGGKISLLAHGDVVLADGSVLDASGKDFSNAGKGGAVSLEAGSETNGIAGPGWV
ncbi:MAG TPA: hypothetical protein VNB29_02650, partial [Chthoniobacterales bacterium]|nr:hypothetical protein [Chthoniobacterales bacterium]